MSDDWSSAREEAQELGQRILEQSVERTFVRLAWVAILSMGIGATMALLMCALTDHGR